MSEGAPRVKPGSRLIVPMNKAGEGSEDPTWCEVSQAAGPLPKHPPRTCLHFYMENGLAWALCTTASGPGPLSKGDSPHSPPQEEGEPSACRDTITWKSSYLLLIYYATKIFLAK